MSGYFSWDQAVSAAKSAHGGTSSAAGVTHEEFEATAYRLIAEQAIYSGDVRSKLAYQLLEDFESEFKKVLEPLGIKLTVNRRLRYAVALPQHSKTVDAGLEPTLMALVLRKIYDESARIGQISEAGEVFVDLVSLGERYRQSLPGREFPKSGQLRAILKTLQRWGIAREEDDPQGVEGWEGQGGSSLSADQPFVVAIRPAIADVLGEAALQRLALFATPRVSEEADIESESAPEDSPHPVEVVVRSESETQTSKEIV